MVADALSRVASKLYSLVIQSDVPDDIRVEQGRDPWCMQLKGSGDSLVTVDASGLLRRKGRVCVPVALQERLLEEASVDFKCILVVTTSSDVEEVVLVARNEKAGGRICSKVSNLSTS